MESAGSCAAMLVWSLRIERDNGGRDGVELDEVCVEMREERASGGTDGVDDGVVDEEDDEEAGMGGRARAPAPPMAGTRLGCLSSGLCAKNGQ